MIKTKDRKNKINITLLLTRNEFSCGVRDVQRLDVALKDNHRNIQGSQKRRSGKN